MATNPIAGLIPRGSLGLKLLLVCLLVLVMGIPLLIVGGLVGERQSRARAGDSRRSAAACRRRASRGRADAAGAVSAQRRNYGRPGPHPAPHRSRHLCRVRRNRRGRHDLHSRRPPQRHLPRRDLPRRHRFRCSVSALPQHSTGVDSSYRFDWSQARIVMFVSDSRAIRNALQLRFRRRTAPRRWSQSPISSSLRPQPSIRGPGSSRRRACAAADKPGRLRSAARAWSIAAGFRGRDAP